MAKKKSDAGKATKAKKGSAKGKASRVLREEDLKSVSGGAKPPPKSVIYLKRS